MAPGGDLAISELVVMGWNGLVRDPRGSTMGYHSVCLEKATITLHRFSHAEDGLGWAHRSLMKAQSWVQKQDVKQRTIIRRQNSRSLAFE